MSMRNCSISDVRKHLKKFLSENVRFAECTISQSAAAGFCVAASQVFTSYLRKNGCNARTVCFKNTWDSENVNRRGSFHCVTRSMGHVVDLTYIQFDSSVRGPVVERVETYKKNWDEYLGEIDDIESLKDIREGPWYYH